MCKGLNNNAIKTYLFLKWKLREGKKVVTRKEIANNIGLSTNSGRGLSEITNILKILISIKLIKKTYIKNYSSEGDIFESNMVLELIPYEEWKEYWDGLGKDIK